MDYSNAVVISAYSKPLRNGKQNAKNYPWWIELVALLKETGFSVIQVGVAGEQALTDDFRRGLSLTELSQLLKQCRTFISVDNFFHHFAALHHKRGIVLWGKSDPNIFGHPLHCNLLKSRACLRKNQFGIWEEEEFDEAVFVKPEEVITYI